MTEKAQKKSSGARVEIKYQLLNFDGKKEQWPRFFYKFKNLLETADYNPEGSPYITTPDNASASKNLRHLLLIHCIDTAEDFWKERPEFEAKGFEMWGFLVNRFAPTGKVAIFENFDTLFMTRQGEQESLATFSAKIRTPKVALEAAGVKIDPPILALLFMHGLNSHYASLRQDFSISPSKWAGKTLTDRSLP